MAGLIFKDTKVLSETERIDLNLWKVPMDEHHPEGEKYSINYREFINGNWVERIRIDNKKRQGHHLHFLGKITTYKFRSFQSAVDDMDKMIRKLKEAKKR